MMQKNIKISLKGSVCVFFCSPHPSLRVVCLLGFWARPHLLLRPLWWHNAFIQDSSCAYPAQPRVCFVSIWWRCIHCEHWKKDVALSDVMFLEAVPKVRSYFFFKWSHTKSKGNEFIYFFNFWKYFWQFSFPTSREHSLF
jgi:hypothetical protein